MSEPGRWRGRVTPLQNAILWVLIALSVPLMLVLLRVDDAGIRMVGLGAYLVLFAVVAGLFRLRFERRRRR